MTLSMNGKQVKPEDIELFECNYEYAKTQEYSLLVKWRMSLEQAEALKRQILKNQEIVQKIREFLFTRLDPMTLESGDVWIDMTIPKEQWEQIKEILGESQ